MIARNLVVSGGPLHDFFATTDTLVALAADEGVASTVPLDPTDALDQVGEPPGWDLVTVNALLWRMPAERHAPLRDGWGHRLADAHAEALLAHVTGGGGLLACHTAPICFDDDPRWRALIGAAWSWHRSHHPPLGPAQVEPTAAGADHPLTSTTPPFDIVDEIYAELDLEDDVVPLLTSAVDGRPQPVLWARSVGRGRVVVDLLGHSPVAIAQPEHEAVLRRAIRWLATDRDPEVLP